MTNLLACERGDVVRGFAPVAGWLASMNCRGNPAGFISHGRLDKVIAVQSGISARDFFLMRNGCSTMVPEPVPPIPCVAYRGCKSGAPVVWCEHSETAYSGTGHGWPPFATRGMWTFFSALRDP